MTSIVLFSCLWFYFQIYKSHRTNRSQIKICLSILLFFFPSFVIRCFQYVSITNRVVSAQLLSFLSSGGSLLPPSQVLWLLTSKNGAAFFPPFYCCIRILTRNSSVSSENTTHSFLFNPLVFPVTSVSIVCLWELPCQLSVILVLL